ncbi:universal stress protein [Celeribacter sp.]|uniref:universal stress protein n=1 Tax=Celeribacter sp. TaxID=1890673 RepID=UPI003A938FD7
MTQKIIVAFDGSDSAVRALEFAIERARALKGEILVAHVLEWSPYSFLTPQEIEERHARRRAELDRAEQAILGPLKTRYADSGVPFETEIHYGHVAEVLLKLVKRENTVQLVIGRSGHGRITRRVFGSVASSLAQSCPIALTILP